LANLLKAQKPVTRCPKRGKRGFRLVKESERKHQDHGSNESGEVELNDTPLVHALMVLNIGKESD